MTRGDWGDGESALGHECTHDEYRPRDSSAAVNDSFASQASDTPADDRLVLTRALTCTRALPPCFVVPVEPRITSSPLPVTSQPPAAMSRYGPGTGNTKLQDAQRKVDDVKNIMHNNIRQCEQHQHSGRQWACDPVGLEAAAGICARSSQASSSACLSHTWLLPPLRLYCCVRSEMTLDRGEKLEEMEEKAEVLENNASLFQRNATKVKASAQHTLWRSKQREWGCQVQEANAAIALAARDCSIDRASRPPRHSRSSLTHVCTLSRSRCFLNVSSDTSGGSILRSSPQSGMQMARVTVCDRK